MADFAVQTKQLVVVSNNLKNTSNQIKSIADEAKRIIGQTRYSISVRLDKSFKSGVVYSSINNCSKDMKSLASALSKASSIYNQYEANIESKGKFENVGAAAVLAGISLAENGKNGNNNGVKSKISEFLTDLLESGGFLGKFLSVTSSSMIGIKSGNWADFLKTFKKGYETIDDTIKATKKYLGYKNFNPTKATSKWFERLVGLEDYAKSIGINASTAKNIGTRWGRNLKKVAQNQLDEFVSAPGIIGSLITGGINIYENYQDYKDGKIDGSRFVTESVVETAVDIGTDLAIGIGVGAVCATVGAPAVAAVAGAMIVSTALDYGTEWISGGKYDSFGEAVSDGVHWVADKACDVAVNCYNKAKDGITAAWNKLFG